MKNPIACLYSNNNHYQNILPEYQLPRFQPVFFAVNDDGNGNIRKRKYIHFVNARVNSNGNKCKNGNGI